LIITLRLWLNRSNDAFPAQSKPLTRSNFKPVTSQHDAQSRALQVT